MAFACDLGPAPEKVVVRSTVGIDLGLSSFATLSDGSKLDNPRFFRNGEATLARRQRELSRKKNGSRGRAIARLLVQKAHLHVRNLRADFLRKLAATLVGRYDCIVHEDLNLRGLAAGMPANSVQDVAWGGFIRALASKAEWTGKWVVPVDPRGTIIHCSACGAPAPKTLSDRIHRCDSYRLHMDRDENAARNILALGRSAAAVSSQSPH